jgi:hypothetical protein
MNLPSPRGHWYLREWENDQKASKNSPIQETSPPLALVLRGEGGFVNRANDLCRCQRPERVGTDSRCATLDLDELLLSAIRSMSVNRVCYVALFVWLMAIAGCQKKPDPQRFVPAEEAARRALESVLKSWQDEQPVGLISNTTAPQVHITDSHRKPGQKLQAFQILGEVPGNAPRCFAVKLTLTNPAAQERVRFVVLGIDPLWVFRHEDLELLSHWEHKMDDEKAAKDPAQKDATNAKQEPDAKIPSVSPYSPSTPAPQKSPKG